MKRFSLFSLFFMLVNIVVSAQISIYTSDDNVESVVYDVEDLGPYEIKVYNQWRKEGDSHEEAMRLINSGRAQNNLIAAPATIIEYGFDIDENSSDGKIILFGFIINSSPKTIKEITLQFEFEGSYGPVYDIKTGDKYMIIKLTDLTGRTKSNLYCDIDRHLLETFHGFKSTEKPQKKPSRQCDVISIKSFHNRKAEKIRLHSVKIKYVDGSTSTKIAVFSRGYFEKSLLEDGPLGPAMKHFERYHTKSTAGTDVAKKVVVEKRNYPIGEPKVSGGLNGYTLKYFPTDTCSATGTVIVRVTVNSTGTVTSASVVGGSATDLTTRNKCLSLAQQSTFRMPVGQTIERTGILTYTIDGEVFSSAAHMPSFPGGDAAMMSYINHNIRYPQSAADNYVEGKVIVQFVVEKDGSVGEVKVARSMDKELDAEAIRVCKSLPKFSPGRNAEGDPVRVWYTLPVTFSLYGTN